MSIKLATPIEGEPEEIAKLATELLLANTDWQHDVTNVLKHINKGVEVAQLNQHGRVLLQMSIHIGRLESKLEKLVIEANRVLVEDDGDTVLNLMGLQLAVEGIEVIDDAAQAAGDQVWLGQGEPPSREEPEPES